MKSNIRIHTFFYLLCLCTSLVAQQTPNAKHPILIISSYNPDAFSVSSNISEFISNYQQLDSLGTFHIENMNCQSFSESYLWKRRMANILERYRTNNNGDSPAAIVLLGQEAWASFAQQADTVMKDVPVFATIASRNGITLPDSTDRPLATWMPQPTDMLGNSVIHSVTGGIVYNYDVSANIRLIRTLYPETKHIAVLTDNSYGGVALQTWIRESIKDFPDLDLILLDGRQNTLSEIIARLKQLPPQTALLLSTWRVDKNDTYFINSATYVMKEAAPDIPTFSMSTVGFGFWAIGGIMPQYRSTGAEMAELVSNYLNGNRTSRTTLVDNQLSMDYQVVTRLHIDQSKLPMQATFINQTPNFFQTHQRLIWGIGGAFVFLLLTSLCFLWLYIRNVRLKNDLIASESKLREAKELAEESNRLKSAFLANMSHEIRTPLNSIVGFANVMAEGSHPQEEEEAYYEIIRTNSDLLLRLINDILDISRLETDRVSLVFEPCNVIDLCQQVTTSVSYSRQSGNTLVFEPRYAEYVLTTDNQRLQQVIINLLTNAIKFTTNGTITLDFSVDERTGMAVFSVTDTGIGIPAEQRASVFERFKKLNEHAQGTGLGLSICQLIVEKWGGKIWVDPDYDDGARFIFTHPIR
ncbi:MAG: sensor histidine kinase [Prevotellaceae bacterium]|jgi:signal transduction histidine kinase|nr:sensor histidine kinase [Prevotellaceae bacterium]